MRAVWITRHGGPEVLEVRETAAPRPAAGEVRIDVRFAGLNFAEVSARQGIYPAAPKPPCIVGYEGSGVIDAVGPSDGGSELGDLAVGTRVLFLSRFGGHASQVCVPAHQVVPLPDDLSLQAAAAMPVNYLTAYQTLMNVRRIRPGDRVLVHMAAGGVGTAALQLCRSVEDVLTFGTASAKKHDYCRAQGCAHPIDYHQVDYAAAVRELTRGEGVDVVLDPLGGKDWRTGYSLLRPGGMLVAFGLANAAQPGRRSWFRVLRQLVQIPRFSPLRMMGDNRAVAGTDMGTLWSHPRLIHEGLLRLLDLHRAGTIDPQVHAVYPFESAPKAFRELEEGRNLGKVLLSPDP